MYCPVTISIKIYDTYRNVEGLVSIRQLSEIADVAGLRMLKGDLVGFAVYYDLDK